jgi:hypothetical protein
MSFAAPAPASIILRNGNKLIVPVAVPGQPLTLPPPCVKCGAPADGKPVTKTFYWHHPALYLLIVVALLIYAIVAMIVRKSIRLTVPLCARHAQRRSAAVTLAWVIPLAGAADGFILPRLGVDGGITALAVVSFIMAGIVIWAIVDYPIRPRSITPYCAVFTGACEEYLRQFSHGQGTARLD